jgi:hypothetical protein
MNCSKSKIFTLFLIIFSVFQIQAQDLDLLSELDLEEETTPLKAIASFKTTRVVNSHSLETTHKKVLDFRIAHRFGLVSGGFTDFFGLDQATMRMAFDYGILDNLTVGIGRSTYEKTIDGYIKYKPLWQTQGSNKVPISVLLVGGISINTLKFQAAGFDMTFPRRLNYFAQVIMGRKFSDKISAQLMPTYVHRNLVATRAEDNGIFALGAAARYKFIKRMSINAEYYFVLPNQIADNLKNSVSVGIDIETGGHVFQLFASNSLAFIEKSFIGENTANFFKGDIHLGFCISRVFDFKGPKNKKPKEEKKSKESKKSKGEE